MEARETSYGGWRPGAGCPLCWLQTLETLCAHEAGGEPGPGHQCGLHHHHLYSTVQYSTASTITTWPGARRVQARTWRPLPRPGAPATSRTSVMVLARSSVSFIYYLFQDFQLNVLHVNITDTPISVVCRGCTVRCVVGNCAASVPSLRVVTTFSPDNIELGAACAAGVMKDRQQ